MPTVLDKRNGQGRGCTAPTARPLSSRRSAAVYPRRRGRNPLAQGAEFARFYWGIGFFWLASLLCSLVAGLLSLLLPPRIGARVGQFLIMAGFRLFLSHMRLLGLFHCDLAALDRLRTEGPLLVAANHPALLDAVLVISRLPRVVCLAKADLWKNPFLGGCIRLARYIRSDSPLSLVREAKEAILRGDQILIFPEGTRTTTEPVNPFRGGVALVARTTGIPVQTVFLEGSFPYLAKGWPLFRKPEFPLVYRARLGRRFFARGDTQEWIEELERYYQQELARTPSISAQ
ncbi:MAG: lysophospholipid acyltransferase family protein [Methylacidiphilaceae bacterium]|nr:lysophospholipid acyltransferase family protein [Candidatus Methylacidiphilaceae bacterium]